MKTSLIVSTITISVLLVTGESVHRINRVGVPAQCELSDADSRWINKFLKGWELVTHDFLQSDPEPLPRIVLFNSCCVWQLGIPDSLPETKVSGSSISFKGNTVGVHAAPHPGTITLPNDDVIPADIIAVAFPYREGKSAFFTLALPELWQNHPVASKDPHLKIRLLSVALHEMIHTRQLPALSRIVKKLSERYELPDQFDDDIIEHRFREVPGYRQMFEKERDLLYKAVDETDTTRRDSLIIEALLVADERHKQFFTGNNTPFQKIEGLFLNMEGIAEWVRFKYHQNDPEWPMNDEEILSFLRGSDNNWSQDEGLALFLLLDKILPQWQDRVLGPDMPSPFDLLRESIKSG